MSESGVMLLWSGEVVKLEVLCLQQNWTLSCELEDQFVLHDCQTQT